MEGIFEGFNNPTNEPSNEEAELVDSALASMVEVIKIVKKHTLTDCPGENFILWKLDLSFCVSVRIHLVIRTCTFVCLHCISPSESEVDSLCNREDKHQWQAEWSSFVVFWCSFHWYTLQSASFLYHKLKPKFMFVLVCSERKDLPILMLLFGGFYFH